jgi:hypothetical protein
MRRRIDAGYSERQRAAASYVTVVRGGGNHSPRFAASAGTYNRIISENGFQSDDGSQFETGTFSGSLGPTNILKDPSRSCTSIEWLLNR